MKTQIVIATMFLTFGSQSSFAQRKETKDKTSIESQVDAMVNSWNMHSYDDLANYATEQTDWVNVVGIWWKGREASQYAHQVYHDSFLKDVVMKKDSLFIRFINRDLAIVHLYWQYSAFYDQNGRNLGDKRSIATLVFVSKNGKWMMEAGQNTDIIPEYLETDPALRMPKRRENPDSPPSLKK